MTRTGASDAVTPYAQAMENATNATAAVYQPGLSLQAGWDY